MPPLNNFTKSCLAVAIGHAMASPVQAANIVVNSSYDTSAVDAECTLREAIVSANGNSAGGNGCVDGTPGLDTITFADVAANNSYVRLEQGTELRITEALKIDGPADGQMSIYGDDADAVFLVDYAGTVEFNNLKIAYGESGIQINGSSLTLNDCTVSRNYAADGIAGGGISLVYSTLNLNRTTISNNYAGAGSDGGGGIFTKSSTVNIYNSTIVGNYADEYGGTVGEGGAILADDSTVNLVNSTITRNWGANTGGLLARNGGLMTLVNSIVSGNNAFYGAGGPTANGQEISALTYGLIAGEYNNLLGHSSKTNAMAFNNFYLSSTDDFIGTSDYENLYLDNILRYLDDYGGPTSTIRLPEGSRAIDNGNNTVCAAAGVNGVDQRGSARADGACDIGAFELNEATITLNDAGDNTGGCDLRNAILSANSGNSYGGCTAGRIYNTIAFDYNYFPYDANNSITLDGPLPRIRRNLLIEGQGASNLVIDANNTGRVFDIYEATVELVSLTLTGGNVADSGGGINAVTSKLILTDSSVSGNNASAGSGGGILVTTSSTLELENSTVSNNNSSNYGGGIYASGSMVSLANSTLSGNTANNDGGGIDAARSTVLNMTNSTVTGNEATNGSGGGIDAYEFADVTLVNTIVSGNTAGTAGNEISDFKNDSTFATNNNLFGDSNSTGTQAFKDFTPDASDYLATSDGGNGTFSPASILLPLGNNGGPTQTHALPEGSPALDKADPAGCQADSIEGEDQRGLPRNSVCDIGSFEFQRTITITVDSKADTSGGAKC
ncbi:MAG: CSLREA domain-containing protein, partial [Arenicella sp.]|nr:CSLREA domain-containing protein [Arenicella sp.]